MEVEIPTAVLHRERFKKKVYAVRDFLLFFIPMDIPKPIQLLCGVFNLLLLLTIFVCLFYFGFTNVMSTVYLSPLNGNRPSPYCELIPQTNSGEFLGTFYGVWEGNPKFVYSSAVYRVSLTSYTATQEQYQASMDKIYSGLQYLGAAMRKSDLSKNVMVWMSLVFANSSAAAQRFSLAGTPDSVFNRQFFDADIGNVNGRCNATSVTTYDRSSHIVRTKFNVVDFMADPVCSETMDIDRIGYNYLIKPDTFEIKFDMRTLITAAAINYGLLAVRSLAVVMDKKLSFDVNSNTYEMYWTYDPKYPGMDPIFCTAPGAYGFSHPLCVMNIADTLVYPFLLHTGKNLSYPTPCKCSLLTTDELLDSTHRCHIFDFQAGFVFWNSEQHRPYFEFAILMASHANYLDESFYATSLVMKYWSLQSNYSTNFSDPAYRQDAFSFCHTSSAGYCSIYTVRTYDLAANFQSTTVSPYYYQLQRGACRDSITSSKEIWRKLVETPFAPITQQYQECSYALSYAVENETGTALGNMSIFTPVCLVVIYFLVKLYKKSGLYQPPAHRSYSAKDKQEALDALAISLLMVRDNKFHSRKSIFISKDMQRELLRQRSMIRSAPSTTAGSLARQSSVILEGGGNSLNKHTSLTSEEMRQRSSQSGISQTCVNEAPHSDLPGKHNGPMQQERSLSRRSSSRQSNRSASLGGADEHSTVHETLSSPPSVHFAGEARRYYPISGADDDRDSGSMVDDLPISPHASFTSEREFFPIRRSRPVSLSSNKSGPQQLSVIQRIVEELRAHATMSEIYNNDEHLGFLHKRIVQINGQDVILEDSDSSEDGNAAPSHNGSSSSNILDHSNHAKSGDIENQAAATNSITTSIPFARNADVDSPTTTSFHAPNDSSSDHCPPQESSIANAHEVGSKEHSAAQTWAFDETN